MRIDLLRFPAGIACAILLTIPGTILRAEPPSISSISPRGIQRGRSAVLVIEGARLAANPDLVLTLPAPRRLLTADPHKPADGRVAFELEVNETDAPGAYPLRIRTDDGISNPVLLMVGLFPELSETEPNDLFEAAQPITYPVTVNGTLGAADRDTFRLSGKAGQTIGLEVEARRIGSGIDPTLHLLNASGREIAMSDDAPGLNVDSRLEAKLPADGDYLIQVHDSMFLGQSPNFYRLKVGPIVYADGVFPLGGRRGSEALVRFEGGNLNGKVLERVRFDLPSSSSLLAIGLPPDLDTSGMLPFLLRVGELPEVLEAARAKREEVQPVAGPATINGRLERPGETDRYSLEVKPGERWLFEIEAQSLGSLLDAVIQVQNPEGGRLAAADDNGASADPRLEFTVPEGVKKLVLAVEDLNHRGGPGFAYRLTVRENRPEFRLSLATTTLNLPRNGTELVAVDVVRQGYNGPVRLELVAPPPGLLTRGGLVPAGQAKGYLSITAQAAAKMAATELVVRGIGEGDVPPATAQGTLFLAADRGMPVSPLRVEAVSAALSRPLPVSFKPEEGPVKVVLGHPRPVKIEVLREEGGAGPIKLQGVFAPPGVTVAEGAVADKAQAGTLVFSAAPGGPLGEGEAAVRGVIKVGGKDVSAVTPVFRVSVVAPFAPQLAATSITAPLVSLKVGDQSAAVGAAQLEGRIEREPPFAGEVELRVEGMPKEMTPAPMLVPGGQSAFRIELASVEPAAGAKHELKLVASTKLGDPKKPTVYTSPPLSFTLAFLPPPAKVAEAAAAAGNPAAQAAKPAK